MLLSVFLGRMIGARRLVILGTDLLTPFESNFMMVVGGFVQIDDPFVSERLSLRAEARYSKAKHTSSALVISHSSVEVPLLLRYDFSYGKLKPTIGLGPKGTFLVNVNINRTASDNELDWIQSGRIQFGLEGAIGAEYELTERKRIFLEGRYKLSRGRHRNSFDVYTPGAGTASVSDLFQSRASTLSIVAGFSF